MIRVAFCDDDLSTLNELRIMLDRYRMTCEQEIVYTAFQSPLNLVAEVERGTRFDILFMDVIMPGETGIEAATEIRKYDSNVKIIFLASSAEYALQSYTVDAYFYQLKPVWEDGFFRLMDSVISACEMELKNSLILRCKSGIKRVEFRRIEYCEIYYHKLYIHLTDGTVLECAGSLDELSKKLETCGNFWRPHRSFLINLNYIKEMSCHAIIMHSLVEIPIPRGKYHEVKDAYMEHVMQDQWVVV